MNHFFSAAMIGAAVAGVCFYGSTAPAQPAAPVVNQPKPGQADVPVKAVVLFSSGVGYFQHYGTVEGSGSTELRFKTQQINDILKSLVLQDLDGGRITTITYPSQDPVAKTLRSFQVDITANPSLGELLNQLRGANVKVSVAGEQVDGTVLGLEKKPKAVGDKGQIEVWVLNLLTNAIIRSVELDSVQQIELEDPQLQEELKKALLALSQSRDQDKKPVTINFTGQGERHVRLGYVVETPVWKTSYRLILGAGEGVGQGESQKLSGNPPATQNASRDGKLQGWAIVENQTDNDWNDVELSLVSGRPISFIEDLYQPLYVPRPVVQPELYASLRPQTYEGGMDAAKKAEEFAGEAVSAAPAAPAARSMEGDKLRNGSPQEQQMRQQLETKQRYAGRALDPTASIASVASAAKIGELFQYTVGSVSLPRQRSAMIPIITDDVEVERLSIYNQATLARNPLNGARVKNTTGKHLLQGPITVLDNGSYAGDASIDNLPPGQERLISYGVDLQVLVDATKNQEESEIQSGKIVKGVLTITRKNVFSQDYLAENKGDKDKTLIIEHPLRQRWTLVDTEKPIETTQTIYRFKGHVSAGKSSKLTVREELVQGEEMAIVPLETDALLVFEKDGHISRPVKDVLAKVIEMKSALADIQRQIQEKQQRLGQITSEQSRVRENMKILAQNSSYYTRLLTKLNDQETQIEKLQGEVEELHNTLETQRKALEQYLGAVNVG